MGYEIYTYDGLNELTDYMDSKGNEGSYTYLPNHYRMSKTAEGTTTYHIWDGENIVAESNGSSIIRSYVRGHQLLTDDERRTYMYDGHGNMVQQLKGSTVENKTRYDAFGNVVENSNVNDTPFGYCGEYTDSESGLVYLRNRYYDARSGRFISEDPVKDGLNWYSYASQNPIMFLDPFGLAITKEDQEAYDSGIMSQYAYNLLDEATNEWDKSNPYDYTTRAEARKKAVAARRMYNSKYVDDFDYTFGTGASAIDDGSEGLFMKTAVLNTDNENIYALSRITYRRLYVNEHPYVQIVSSCGYAVGSASENVYVSNIKVVIGQTTRLGGSKTVEKNFEGSTYYILSNFDTSIYDSQGALYEDIGATSDYYFSNGYRLTISNNKNMSTYTVNGNNSFDPFEPTLDDYRAMLGGR